MRQYLRASMAAFALASCSGENAAVTEEDEATGGTASDGAASACSLNAVDAGYARVGIPGGSVSFNATVDDSAGCAAIVWTQLSGTAAAIDDDSVEDPVLTLPNIDIREILVFQISASGDSGALTDQVNVEVWTPFDSSSDKTVLGDFSSKSGWQCDADPVVEPSVTVSDLGADASYTGNGVPAHATGTFPNNGNPNSIGGQSVQYFVPNSPVHGGTPTEMREFGITLAGVKLERDTAETYNNAGQWHYEAITPGFAETLTPGAEWEWLGTDCSNGHAQPTGAYHYHGVMEGILAELGEANGEGGELILGGHAADGFPFYLRYGYTDPNDASSGLAVMKGSWEVKSGTRSSGPGGSYDGTFREDWEFVGGSGDLDECNGRFGVTPEYPGGIYHYYITDDYPYIPHCVFGAPDSSFPKQ